MTHGRTGFGSIRAAKLKEVWSAGLAAVEYCCAAGTKIGFGSGLLGEPRDMQSRSLVLQAEAQTPREVLASATAVNAAPPFSRQAGRAGSRPGPRRPR